MYHDAYIYIMMFFSVIFHENKCYNGIERSGTVWCYN